MKKLCLLFALVVWGTVSATPVQMVRLTRFEGKQIAGVHASGTFQVELIRSDKSYAVVEINADYEDALRFEIDGRGVVTVGFKPNRRIGNNVVCRARIYLQHPELIDASGASGIACNGDFETGDMQIKLSGASRLNNLTVSATGTVNLLCSGASRIDGARISCREMTGIVNGASRTDIAHFDGNLSCDLSGASRMTISGNAGIVGIKACGASDFEGQGLGSTDCSIAASSASKVNTGVVQGGLTVNGSSASSITYKGDPAIRGITISSASTFRKAL